MSAVFGFVFLVLTIGFTVGAQLAFKTYSIRPRPVLLAATIAMFAAVPPCSYMALRTMPLDIVYMSTSLTIVLATLASLYLLDERLILRQWVGVFLVVVGVLIYSV